MFLPVRQNLGFEKFGLRHDIDKFCGDVTTGVVSFLKEQKKTSQLQK